MVLVKLRLVETSTKWSVFLDGAQISQLLTVLGHMLLYNLYIDVLIALVLQYQDSP